MNDSVTKLEANFNPATVETLHDFVNSNSIDGRYSRDTAIRNLLSSISPDSRAFILHCLVPGIRYKKEQGGNEVRKDNAVSTVVWAARVRGADEKTATMFGRAVGNVLPNSDLLKCGDTSWRTLLVRGGAMAAEEDGTGVMRYSLKIAGELLHKPLADCAIYFVSRARRELPEHRFDSMENLLGGRNGIFNVYRIVKYLVENGPSTETAISSMLGKDAAGGNAKKSKRMCSSMLHKMSYAGLISLASFREKSYKTCLGGIHFLGEAEDTLYHNAKSLIPDQYIPKDIFRLVVNYIADDLNGTYTTILIADHIDSALKEKGEKLRFNLKCHVRLSLRSLESLGMLERSDDVQRSRSTAFNRSLGEGSRPSEESRVAVTGNKAQSIVYANDMTRLFYDLVLKNVERAANLVPEQIDRYPVTMEDEKEFIANMNEEKCGKGTKKSGAVMDRVERYIRMRAKFAEGKGAGIKEIQKSLGSYGFELPMNSLRTILGILRDEGKVEHVGGGFYTAPGKLLRKR